MFKRLVVCLFLVSVPAVIMAQDDTCPAIVSKALDATDQHCESTGRNQACYGNVLLQVEPQSGIESLDFENVGDTVDVAEVRMIRLSEMNVDTGAWGVALLRIQANLPDTLPGQNVTFLLFGDTEITNAVDFQPELPTLTITVTGSANLRGGPSTNDAVVGSVTGGEELTVDGRLEDGSWLRLQRSEGEDSAWVFTQLVTVDGDINTLNVVDASDASGSPLKPMQAFYFKSGVGGAACAEASENGLLVQTPEGVGKITLTVNEVNMELGSTAFLQAEAGNEMWINVVEGSGSAEAFGKKQLIPAGTYVTVPIDDDLKASGPPSEPQPYTTGAFNSLPVNHLEREITIHPALTAEELESFSNIQPVPGTWVNNTGQVSLGDGCAGLNTAMFPQVSQAVEVSPDFDFVEMAYQMAEDVPGTVKASNPEPSLYIWEYEVDGATVYQESRVISPTRIESFTRITVEEGGCVITIPAVMEPQ